MTTLQTSAKASDPLAPVPVAEQPARATRGVKVLVAGIVAVAGGIALVWYANTQTGAAKSALIWAGILLFIISGVALAGLTPVRRGRRGSCSCSASTAARSASRGCSG